MVLQLASSPLASRPSQTTATSTSNSSPSSSNPASTTTASSILQLSFFGISKGKRQHHSSHQRRRQRTTSSSNLLHSFKPDQTHKKTLTTFTEQWRWAVFKTMVRLAAFSSALYPILIVPTLRTNGLEDGFGRGSQYLTIVGLLVTMICFGLSIVGDMLNKPA
ncbi:hypothetical protein EC991_005521 [Linnemannia zychae]|nr:hypothetical protein EC991_005521 [Linnemannia zychae]